MRGCAEIAGQVQAVDRLVDADRYCARKVEELVAVIGRYKRTREE